MIGQIINYRYEVLEKIGDGELFSVYKSRDKVLNRLVALKVLGKEPTDDADFRAAVCEGYEASAGLAHPNIARVLDVDNSSDACLIACEFAHGVSVKDRIRRGGQLAVPTALDITISVLEALEYAHANRIGHGDIRSQDVIVSPDGEVKLTDFGTSYALRKNPAFADKHIMRSVHYQAPEVTEGALPTVLSDVYSVGVMLYEMLTGVLPFGGSTAVAVALKKVKEAPSAPRLINAAVPKSLSDAVMKAIEKLPEDRYSSVSAMLLDLRAVRDSFRTGVPNPAATQPVRAPRPQPDESTVQPSEDGLKKWYVMMVVLFIVVVGAFGAITMHIKGSQGDIRVPPLLGKTWDEAEYEAKEKGITLVDDGQVYNDTYEAGQICMVNPAVGATVPASDPRVKVRISQGPSRIAIPDLNGMAEPDANQAAVSAGFTLGKVTEQYSDKIPVNAVISQVPEAGMMRSRGSTIDLTISLGPKLDTGDNESTDGQTSSGPKNSRRFNVAVEVPDDADGAQKVSIVVNDDRGETTVYEESRDPGEKFTYAVTAYGDTVKIRTYVGDKLESEDDF